MTRKLRGRGHISHAGANERGNAYAIITATQVEVYLDAGLMIKWPGWKPGMTIDLFEGDYLEFWCVVRDDGGYEVTEVTEYQPVPLTNHEGELRIEWLEGEVWPRYTLYMSDEWLDELDRRQHARLGELIAYLDRFQKPISIRFQRRGDRIDHGSIQPLK